MKKRWLVLIALVVLVCMVTACTPATTDDKGKEVVLITDTFDAKTAKKYDGIKVEGKKYSNYNFTYLKNKYNVDELLFVNLKWGVMISYYSMIETGREGFCYFDTRLVNTSDNSLHLSNNNSQFSIIKGKWNVEPEYENAVSNIKIALDKAIEIEKGLLK
jgi:predicted small secreted protein